MIRKKVHPVKSIKVGAKLFNRIRLIALLFLGFVITELQAQIMYIKESIGTQTAYALYSIQKMTFSSGNLTVTKADNSSSMYALNTLQYLNFTDVSTSIEVQKDTENKSFLAYPNPVIDELTIDLKSMKNLNGTLSILNIEGRVMKAQSVSSSGIVIFDMSPFPMGIYFCRYIDGTVIKTVKIIKH